MAKAIGVIQKKRGRGRPATGHDPLMSMRMPVALKSRVKDWAKNQDEKLSISKAICHLVERGLDADSAVKPRRVAKRKD